MASTDSASVADLGGAPLVLIHLGPEVLDDHHLLGSVSECLPVVCDHPLVGKRFAMLPDTPAESLAPAVVGIAEPLEECVRVEVLGRRPRDDLLNDDRLVRTGDAMMDTSVRGHRQLGVPVGHPCQ